MNTEPGLGLDTHQGRVGETMGSPFEAQVVNNKINGTYLDTCSE